MSEHELRAGLPSPPAPELAGLDDLWEAIDADSRASGPLTWLRELDTGRRVLLAVAMMFAVAVVSLSLQGVRPDVQDAMPRLAAQLGVLGLFATITLVVSLRPLHRPPLGRPAHVLAWLPLLVFVAALMPIWPGMEMGFWEAMPVHLRCLGLSTLTSLAAVAPFVLADRTGLERRWSTVAAAGAAGAFGFVVQVANCPLISPEHIGLAHGFGGIAVTAVLMIALAARGRA